MLSPGRGLCFPLVKTCVFGNEPKAPDEVPLAPRAEPAETSPTWQALKLLFCAAGLQVSRQALRLFLGRSPRTGTLWNQSFHPAGPNSLLVVVLCVLLLPEAHHRPGVVGGNAVFSVLLSLPSVISPIPL